LAIIFFSPWIPIVGDFIPLIAGAKKYNFRTFTIAIISGKIIKAIAIVFFSSWILPMISP
jgi:membrane protein YqaA with SNARE-associated domain